MDHTLPTVHGQDDACGKQYNYRDGGLDHKREGEKPPPAIYSIATRQKSTTVLGFDLSEQEALIVCVGEETVFVYPCDGSVGVGMLGERGDPCGIPGANRAR